MPLAARLARRPGDQFGRTPVTEQAFPTADTAQEGLVELDEEYANGRAGVGALGEDGFARPRGPTEERFADAPWPTWS